MNPRNLDKRTQLTETALKLFYEHGIHAVGINEVLKASGIAKKTLYSHFSSKEELISAAVEYRDGMFLSWLQAQMEQAGPGKPALESLFAALDDWINERIESLKPFRGCFFINTSAEYSTPGSPIYEKCRNHKQKFSDLVFSQCQALIEDEAAARSLSDSLVLLKEGAIVAAHVLGDKQAAVKAWDTARLLIRGFGRE